MAKAIYDQEDQIPEGLKGEYELRDGKWALKIEGEPLGFVPKDTHNEFRNNNITLANEKKAAEEALAAERAKLAAFEGVDPEEFKRLKAQQDDLKDKKVLRPDEYQQVIAAKIGEAIDPLKTQLTSMQQELQAKDEKLRAQTFETEVTKAAVGSACNPGAEVFLSQQAQRDGWKADETGNVQRYDAAGNPVFSLDNPGTPQSLKEYMAEQQKANPWAFKASGGGGGDGGDRRTQDGSMPVIDLEDPEAWKGDNLEAIAKGKFRPK